MGSSLSSVIGIGKLGFRVGTVDFNIDDFWNNQSWAFIWNSESWIFINEVSKREDLMRSGIFKCTLLSSTGEG